MYYIAATRRRGGITHGKASESIQKMGREYSIQRRTLSPVSMGRRKTTRVHHCSQCHRWSMCQFRHTNARTVGWGVGARMVRMADSRIYTVISCLYAIGDIYLCVRFGSCSVERGGGAEGPHSRPTMRRAATAQCTQGDDQGGGVWGCSHVDCHFVGRGGVCRCRGGVVRRAGLRCALHVLFS